MDKSEKEDKKTSSCDSLTAEERGVYDFADGGRYIGEWNNGGANGYGVCLGPEDSGVFQGKWVNGSQTSGVFRWSNGQQYFGTWKDGARHGLGREVRPDGSEFTGEFEENTRGPFGVLKLSSGTGALYQGTWEGGLQDGVGVEIYTDKGVYRGQYRKGYRNGYGKRSSHGYELYEKKHSTKCDAVDGTKKGGSLIRSTNPDLMSSLNNSMNRSSSSVSIKHDPPVHHHEPDSTIQVYEGQWYKDKRHGHGVLRVPGSYMYCGEWSLNNRTGHGTMIYEDGRREEGMWEKGQLVIALKRKKLSLKHHQLESKVKQAHTLALQAADISRTKSLLAESRASAASGRAKLAVKAAEEANNDAEIAKKKADFLYNTEHKQTEQTTPSFAEFVDYSAESLDNSSLQDDQASNKSELNSLLSVPAISPTCSLENINKTSSPGSSVKKDNHSAVPIVTSDSDSGIVVSMGHSGEISESSSVPVNLGKSSSIPDSMSTLRKSSDHKLEKQPSEPSAMSELTACKRRSVTQVDHSTGEIITVIADALDETGAIPGSVLTARHSRGSGAATTALLTSHQLHRKQKAIPPEQNLNVDMLKQMAHWNKMIAYINFILLLFLLLLIVFVVAFLSTTISQNNPTNFMTPMA